MGAVALLSWASLARRHAGRTGASQLPAVWQQRLFPRSGWFRVSQKGIPEPCLLETIRLHLLPEQAQLQSLRRLSTCLRTGEAVAHDAQDVPLAIRDCLMDLCASLRARHGLFGAGEDAVHRAAAHARSACRSAALTNEQSASIVVSGELGCLTQWETRVALQKPRSLVEQAMLTWSAACQPRDGGKSKSQ